MRMREPRFGGALFACGQFLKTSNLAWLLGEHGHACIEPTAEAEEAWVAHVSEIGLSARQLLIPGANISVKPRISMPYIGSVRTYQQKCAEVAPNGY